MKRNSFRWLISPLLLFASVTCNSDALQAGGNCQSGADSDGDGLTDDIECRVGSDPQNADSNGDGLSDGDAYNLGLDPTKLDTDGDGVPDVSEVKYPKICIAQERNAQRRPPQTCNASSECQAGEDCKGLDPTKTDSDGDGVLDKDEDVNYDGNIEFAVGETDPRLWDTDGDGQNDASSGAAICRPDGLGMVTQKGLGPIQLGHDPVFGMATAIPGIANGNGVVVDDAAAEVAGLTISTANRGADVRADATAVEADIRTALTAVAGTTVNPVLTQGAFTTHEGLSALRSTFLVTTGTTATTASALRDRVINRLTGGTAPGGGTAGSGTSFFVEVSTVRRTTALIDVVLGVAPSASYNDTAKATSIRLDDLVNSTGVAEGTRTLDHACQGVIASRLPIADFVWTVDTSGSMDDDQTRLGNAAQIFFNKMNSAGVDFRVAVFRSGATGVNFTTTVAGQWPNGFEFILGTDTMGPLKLARYVTQQVYMNMATDNPNLQPFPLTGNSESPVAGGIHVNQEFERRASINDPNPNFKLRPNATKVAFFVTDEPVSDQTTDANDWLQYFDSENNPDTGTRWAPGGTYNAAVLDGIVKYWRDNQFLTYGMVPVYNRTCKPTPDTRDLPRCVIEGNGGAFISIAQATDQAVVNAAMDRIANDVVGASSPIVLQRSPITHTIKVTVRGNVVPRSRSNGFDYNQASKSIVFYGSTYRPQLGDTVYVSYRVWTGATG